MAEFKKEAPKDEAIISELKNSIVNALAERLKVSVTADEKSLGMQVVISFGDKEATALLSMDDLQSLNAIEKVYQAGKELASKL